MFIWLILGTMSVEADRLELNRSTAVPKANLSYAIVC